MQPKIIKPKIIKPTILLADGWEEYFVFQDFIGFKNWDMPVLKKKKRGFVVSEYQMCNLVKLDESKLLLGSFSDILRGMIYSGLFAIAKCNMNIKDQTIEKQINNMKRTVSISNNYMEELLSKIEHDTELETLFINYGNNYICKKYYKERFGRDLMFKENITKKIDPNIQKLCFEITDTKPNIHSFKVEKNKETKSISLWIHREMLLVVEKIQHAIYKDYMISEILRGALLQGLYMVAQWIISDKFNTEEQDILKITTSLENMITRNNNSNI